MRPGGNTATGAVGMQGLAVPTAPLRETAPDLLSARIEAAEARRDQTKARRMTLDEARRAVLTAQQDNIALQVKLDERTTELQAARERIAALEGQVAEAGRRQSRQPRQSRRRPEPVIEQVALCAGGCGAPVDPAYIERTGRTWHGPCQAQVPAEVQAAAKTRSCAA